MTRGDRLKRDVEAYLYRIGWGQPAHTLWECALKFNLSPNQIWLNNKKILIKIQELVSQTDVPATAQKLGVAVDAIERIVADANRGSGQGSDIPN